MTPLAEPAAPARPPGRPRSPQADRAILDATLEVLAEVGFGRLTVERVAEYAGVGKATIYRRWPAKMALVLAAVDELSRSPSPEIDTGTTRGDLILLLASMISAITTTIAGRILPGLIAETALSPELRDALTHLWVTRRELLLAVLERGVARGELPGPADLGLTADLLYGAVHYRFLVSATPMNPDFAENLVDAVLPQLGRSNRTSRTRSKR